MILADRADEGFRLRPCCHVCGTLLDEIPLDENGDYRQAAQWAILALTAHRETCPLRSDHAPSA